MASKIPVENPLPLNQTPRFPFKADPAFPFDALQQGAQLTQTLAEGPAPAVKAENEFRVEPI